MFILQKNDKGTFVQWLQVTLVQEGLSVSDYGLFGAATEEAVKKFQAKKGLAVDGKVGNDTLKALKINLNFYRWNGTNKEIVWILPSSIDGLRGYNVERGGADQFATRQTIDNLIKVAKIAREKLNTVIQVGDISRLGGGTFFPHASHKDGDAADIRPIRKDEKMLPVDCRDAESYDALATKVLVFGIKKLFPSVVILFNDDELVAAGLTRHHAGHYNHLHIKF